MAKKKGERGTDYYAPSGSRYWQYAGRIDSEVPRYIPSGDGKSRPVRIPGRDGGNNPYASKQTPPTYNRESAEKNSKSITQSGYNYDKKSSVTKANNAAATKNSQSIAKAGTVYRSSVGTKTEPKTEPKKNTSVNTPSLIKGGKNGAKDAVNGDVRIVNQGRPRSTDDYERSRKALENAFGKQTQDKGTVTKANTAAATKNSQSISQSGYNYDRNKQTGRKVIESAFTPSSTSKPTSTIKVGGVKGSVKVTPKTTTSKPSSTITSQPSRKEPAYNPAKINAEAKARAEAQSKAAAAQAAAKANAKGGMSEEAKKKAAAAARRGR